MNEAIVTEYVELCARLAALDAETEKRSYARIDQLWYEEMTAVDREEAQRRLTNSDRSWHDVRRAEASP